MESIFQYSEGKDYYVDFISTDILEIIISYLNYGDFILFSKSSNLNRLIKLNYLLIFRYHFDSLITDATIKTITYFEYKAYLGAEDFKNKLRLSITVEHLRNATSLNLDPTEIKYPNQLTNLKNFNKLTYLPESIGELTYLLYLTLDNNHLNSLPNSFKKLRNLKELWLRNNRFEDFPNELPDNLRELDITGNPLMIDGKLLKSKLNRGALPSEKLSLFIDLYKDRVPKNLQYLDFDVE